MPDLLDGESVDVQGSASKPYVLKNTGGVYSCTCPAWRNQSLGIEQRTCKHLKKLRGAAVEVARVESATRAAGTDLQTALARSSSRSATDADDADTTAKAGPPLLLAERWDNLLDLTGWWMSEKLDGVRAYWNGKAFLSRLGNVYHAPDWFTAGLPDTPLDGELWLDRKAFQRTISIVRRQDKSLHWQQIKYLVFDAPDLDEPFEQRVEFLVDHFGRNSQPYAQPHAQAVCRDLTHLQVELARVEALGGEGLMLRQPLSRYVVGRSSTLLKLKTFHDAEARVLGHEQGKGKHVGRLGALLVELADGTKFSVGTGFTDRLRERPPAIGSYITFRYQELSDGGVPRFPSFVGLRTDAPPGDVTAPAKSRNARTFPAPIPLERPKSSLLKGGPRDDEEDYEDGEDADPEEFEEELDDVAAPTVRGVRRFEFTDAKSAKFWEISLSGTDVVTRYGRIGSDGQSTTKSFADTVAAQKYSDKVVIEKTEKGYSEQPSAT